MAASFLFLHVNLANLALASVHFTLSTVSLSGLARMQEQLRVLNTHLIAWGLQYVSSLYLTRLTHWCKKKRKKEKNITILLNGFAKNLMREGEWRHFFYYNKMLQYILLGFFSSWNRSKRSSIFYIIPNFQFFHHYVSLSPSFNYLTLPHVRHWQFFTFSMMKPRCSLTFRRRWTA